MAQIFNSVFTPLAFLKGEGPLYHIDIKNLDIANPTKKKQSFVKAKGTFTIHLDLADIPYTNFQIYINYEEDSVLTIKDCFVTKTSLTTKSKDSMKRVEFIGKVELVSRDNTYYLKPADEDPFTRKRKSRAQRVLATAKRKEYVRERIYSKTSSTDRHSPSSRDKSTTKRDARTSCS